MRVLTSPLHIARHIMSTTEGWLLFVEVALGGGSFFRLVRDNKHHEANGKKWQRASIEIELPVEDAEGALGELVIAIPNVSQLALAYVEVDDEILGRTLTAWLVHESSMEAFDANLSWQHRILDMECDEVVARFHCGHSAELVRVPGPLFNRIDFPQLLPSAGVTL